MLFVGCFYLHYHKLSLAFRASQVFVCKRDVRLANRITVTALFESGINGFQDFVVDLEENIF